MASTFSPTDFTSYSEAGPTLPVTNVAGETAQLTGLNEGFQANGLVQLAAGVEATPAALGTVTAINTGCRFGVVVWAAVAAWELARDGARLFYDKPA